MNLSSETRMGSASEGEVLRAVRAIEVKSIWHIENAWVSVCSVKEWNDELILLDAGTIFSAKLA